MGTLVTGEFGGKRDPRQVLLDALSECDEYEDLVIVVVDKNKDCRMGWSDGRYLKHIGMMTFAADCFSRDMAENK